jgi:hypothetical protein
VTPAKYTRPSINLKISCAPPSSASGRTRHRWRSQQVEGVGYHHRRRKQHLFTVVVLVCARALRSIYDKHLNVQSCYVNRSKPCLSVDFLCVNIYSIHIQISAPSSFDFSCFSSKKDSRGLAAAGRDAMAHGGWRRVEYSLCTSLQGNYAF